jgi:HAE1 family hydrophobic/amphiphilic exporter-1
MFLSDVSIRKPVLATMMIGAILVFGIISRDRLGVELYPNVDFPNVSILTTLQGASPETMETEVTDYIEDAISSVEGIKHLNSSSMLGYAQVQVEFVLERDVDTAAQDIRDKITLANRLLPKDVDPPVINKVDISAHPIIWLAVTGSVPRKYLGQVADEVFKPQIQTLQGVGSVVIGGLQKRKMRVWLDAKKLDAYHLTADDVEKALLNKNIELPGGRIESSTRELSVKTMGELQSVDAFNRLIIAYRGQSPIRLQDVGFAEDSTEDVRSVGRFQSVNSMGLGVVPRSGSNHVEVCNRVKATMLKLQKNAPPGINLAVAFDTSEFIKNSIADVQKDLLTGSLLAALVVFLFLRSYVGTVIIGLAIPVSLVGTFSIIYMLGFSINSMTMLAMSLCTGLVVDDAIIVLENIHRYGEMGKDSITAAQEGTNEISFAATAATLSIVAVFLPVAFISGLIGRFYYQFGVTVSAAVLISLFMALTLTPMLCSRFLRVTKKHGRIYEMLEQAFIATEQAYRRTLEKALNHRILFAAGAAAIFFVSLGLFKILGSELVQKEDRDDFMVRLECPVGISLPEADKKLFACEKFLRTLPELQSVFALIGGGGGFRQETNKGFMFVQLKKSWARERTQQEIMSQARKELNRIPGVAAYVEDVTMIGGGMSGRNAPLQFKIKGPELTVLQDLSSKIISQLRSIPGLVGVGSDMELTKPEVRVYIDRDKAGDLGVDVRAIASAINTLIGGRDISKFKQGGKTYDVMVRLVSDQRSTFADINRLLVRTNSGELIRLSNVVQVKEEIGPDLINRFDRQRSTTIYANLEGKTLGDAVEETKDIVKKTLPAGYSIEFSGQAETMAETIKSIVFVFALTTLITYMVLASQFESFVHPFTIMLAVPLGVTGALATLFITRNTINIMSLIGMIMLLGLVIKNSILLVDYTNVLRATGMNKRDALLQAGPVRLRPILMTAISTVAGVLPVALGLGAGGASRAPMGIAVAGGMTTSTLLTLYVVPVVYSLLDDVLEKAQSLVKRGTVKSAVEAGSVK